MTLENPKEPRLKAVPESINFAEQEEYTLQKWESEKTFQKSMEMAEAAELPDFTFYDGPPFATGLPHYGHILAGTIKDVVTRYAHQTGHRVVRRFGWDCHGLPVEYEIDQMLGITGPSDVEKMGIAAYNDHCRSIVMRYATEWESIVKRMGRWIDFENDYKTLDVDFMESVWWVFKQLFEKGLVYQGFKVMPFSTQCNTPLSNFESGLNYKDVSDPAVVVAMRVKDGGKFEGASLLAWTTTPWTLPSNLALCVNEKFDYVLLKEFESGNKYILGKSRIEELYPKKKKAKKSKEPLPYEIFSEFKGSELVGVQYYPLFDYFEDTFQASAFRVLSDDYVTDDSGTGIVHQAPAFGEDDYRVCLAHGVIEKKGSLLCPVAVDVSGLFTMPIRDFVGIHVKKSDKMIIQHLKESGNLVRQNQIVHSYPHCWRSDTPLIYKAVPSWFVDVPAIRDRLVANNAKTYWVPSFVKEKRFHNWLEGAREWAISRNRYWGTPLPIWKSDDGEEIRVVGSIDELRELTGNPEVGFDLHRDSIDHLTIPSQQGKGALRRVPEVFDCWFESGSMPYAQMHYPFENKEAFDNGLFPANFIAEGLDQTRGWFYTLMVISTALFDKPAFENLIVNGLVLAEDGKKMSKRLKNYPDPMLVVSEYGADALRVYLISSPVVRAEPLKFKKSGVYDVLKEIFIPWFNTYRLFVAQARRLEVEEGISFEYDPHIHTNTDNDMDRWIMASLQSLVRFVRQEMEQYRLDTVVPEALKFLDQLSKWYVRLNKGRLKGDEGSEDAHRALKVLFEVLLKLCRLMSPLTPFFTEFMYQNLKSVLPEGIKMDSVHFLSIPAVIEEAFDDDIERDVSNMQRVVDLGRIARENSGFTSFRFPYPELLVIHRSKVFLDGISRFSGYIKEQLNVKKITLLSEIADYVTLSIRADSGKLGPRFRSKKDQFIAALGELDFESLIRLLEVGKLDVDFFDGSSNSVETVVLDDDVFLEFKFRGDASRYEAVSFGELVVIVDKQMDLVSSFLLF